MVADQQNTGGFAGTSGESSSSSHRLIDNTISKINTISADEDLVKVSQSEHEDLLDVADSSFATFSVITLLDVDLVSAKPESCSCTSQ